MAEIMEASGVGARLRTSTNTASPIMVDVNSAVDVSSTPTLDAAASSVDDVVCGCFYRCLYF